MAEDVITAFRVGGTNPAADVITRFRLGSGAVADVITGFRLTQETGFTAQFADPIPDTVNPFELIPLTVDASLPPETVTVTQVAGAPAQLTGSGLNWVVKAPANRAASTMSFRLAAARTGQPTAIFTSTIGVRAHGGFWRKDGSAVQIRVMRPGTTTDPTVNLMAVSFAGSNTLSIATSAVVPTYATLYTTPY